MAIGNTKHFKDCKEMFNIFGLNNTQLRIKDFKVVNKKLKTSDLCLALTNLHFG